MTAIKGGTGGDGLGALSALSAVGQPLLSARGLAVGYPGSARPVASGLDLDLRPGEMVCLLGPNGAGKSTLIRTLAGLQPALAGEILWEGGKRPAGSLEWARRAAIVLTERFQGGNLSVYDLAALGRHPHTGWTGRLGLADRTAVDEALRSAGAWDLRHRLFDTLSDGEKQKSMLARALAQDPALLFLDEPTAFLDLPRRVEAMRLLRRISREKGRAVLLSTHDLDLALRAADRLWLLAPGGVLRALHGHPRARAGLGGEPSLRFWTARALEREGYAVEAGEAPGGGVPGGGADIRVEARILNGSPRWILESRGARGEFDSLGGLVRALRTPGTDFR